MIKNDWAPFQALVETRVREEMAVKRAAAVAVVVVASDAPPWIKTFDRGPVEGKVDENSRFRVGSISKMMTALTTLRLRDEGKLNLDDDVNALLPWFTIHSRFPAAPVTPRLLLTHHSGLPSNLLRGMYGSTARPLADQAKLLADHWLARPPGKNFLYSDVGYSLLGAVIEAADHDDFASIADARVFAPLGLTKTTFVPTRDLVLPIVDGEPFDENPPTTLPANGLTTTPADMAKFLTLLVAKDPRVTELFDAADVDDAPAADLDWRTGFGLNRNAVWASPVGPVYWHSGQTLAFTAELVVCPAAGVAVAVMTNTREAGFLPNTIAWEAMAKAIETRTGVAVAAAEPAAAASFSDDELDSVAGVYPTEYGTFSLTRRGDHLRGRAFDEVVTLEPTAKKTFVPVVQAFGFVPVTPDLLRGVELAFADVDGQRVLLSHHRGLRVARGVRVEPSTLPLAWMKRRGHWKNPEQGDDQITVDGLDLYEDDGFWFVRVAITHQPKPLILPLAPIDDDNVVTAGVGRYLGETIHVSHEADGSERLHIVGYALKR